MALKTNPVAANLSQVYTSLGKNPATCTFIASGNVTPPTGFVLPTCQISPSASGNLPVPSAAAHRLGVRTVAKYRVKLMHTRQATQGSNTAVYLTSGIYETNFTFDGVGYKQGLKDAEGDMGGGMYLANPANYLRPWKNAAQIRVYFVMPNELAPTNQAAEREHCDDFIHAYDICLKAVNDRFSTLSGTTLDGYVSAEDARQAMIRRVGEQLHPALRPLACDVNKLKAKFERLFQKSRDGRDGRGWHSFGIKTIPKPPANLPVSYLTGKPRPEAGRLYVQFTSGQTQINIHPSAAVITL